MQFAVSSQCLSWRKLQQNRAPRTETEAREKHNDRNIKLHSWLRDCSTFGNYLGNPIILVPSASQCFVGQEQLSSAASAASSAAIAAPRDLQRSILKSYRKHGNVPTGAPRNDEQIHFTSQNTPFFRGDQKLSRRQREG